MPFRKGHRTTRTKARLVPLSATDVRQIWDTIDKARMLVNQAGHQMRMGFGSEWVTRSKAVEKAMIKFQMQITDAYFDKNGQALPFDEERQEKTGRNALGQRTIF